jgi:hypothetical protein
MAGPILDGVAPHMIKPFHTYNEKETKPASIAQVLEEAEADVLVNYIPVGSNRATRTYAEACLKAKCALANCIPEFIASNSKWATRFEKAGLPVAGDDIKRTFQGLCGIWGRTHSSSLRGSRTLAPGITLGRVVWNSVAMRTLSLRSCGIPFGQRSWRVSMGCFSQRLVVRSLAWLSEQH